MDGIDLSSSYGERNKLSSGNSSTPLVHCNNVINHLKTGQLSNERGRNDSGKEWDTRSHTSERNKKELTDLNHSRPVFPLYPVKVRAYKLVEVYPSPGLWFKNPLWTIYAPDTTNWHMFLVQPSVRQKQPYLDMRQEKSVGPLRRWSQKRCPKSLVAVVCSVQNK